MTKLSIESLENVHGGQAEGGYVCRSLGYKGEPVIWGDRAPTMDGAKQSYMDRCEANGNWKSACWINRVCGF